MRALGGRNGRKNGAHTVGAALIWLDAQINGLMTRHGGRLAAVQAKRYFVFLGLQLRQNPTPCPAHPPQPGESRRIEGHTQDRFNKAHRAACPAVPDTHIDLTAYRGVSIDKN